jgi:hypothetical protein
MRNSAHHSPAVWLREMVRHQNQNFYNMQPALMNINPDSLCEQESVYLRPDTILIT